MKITKETTVQNQNLANSPNLNLQTRPFAKPNSDHLDNLSKDGEKESSHRTNFSENLLEKLVFNSNTEKNGAIQRKPQNRLKLPINEGINNSIQAKLNIGEPNDKYEKEADETATKVVEQINSYNQENSVQRQNDSIAESTLPTHISPLQRKLKIKGDNNDGNIQTNTLVQKREALGGGETSADLESSIQRARGSGQSLNPHLQETMGQAMGADFSDVKVHTDSQSDRLNQSIQAKAFTTGQDVFFRQGEYNPSSKSGQELIAHELTHVVQQNGNRLRRKPLPNSSQVSQIQAAPTNQVQRLWNKKTFREHTKDGILDRRGETIKSIEQLIDEYGKLNPYSTKDLKSTQDLAKEIREHVNNWIQDHTGDKSRSTRMVGMQKFLTHLDTEEIPKLNKIEQDILDKRNTTAGTLELEDSQRTGKIDAIKKKYEGSAKSSLEKVGWLIDASVPNPGDKSKLEIELKIPCDPSGMGFVGMHLVCQSERKKVKELNTRCELTVTGGAKFAGLAELKAEIGGYFESQAADSSKVMQLVSYAIYRRFVESKVLPVEMSNYMWGGTTSSVGYKRAEKWAGNVEKEVFGKDDKAYVETGLVGAITAQGGIKDVGGVGLGGKLAVKGSGGTRYDQKGVKEGKKRLLQNQGGGGLGDSYSYSGRGDAQESIGRRVYQLEPSFEATCAMFKMNGKAKFVWLGDPSKEKDLKAKLDEWSIECAGQVSIPIHQGVLGGMPALLGGMVNSVGQSVRRAAASESGSKSKGQILGLLLGMSEDTAIAGAQVFGAPATQFTVFKPGKSLNDQMGLAGSKGEIGVKIGFKYKKKPADDKGEIEISLDYTKSGQLMYVDKILAAQQNAVDMLTVKQESFSRLATFKRDKTGNWAWNPELD
ncbi:DUF4157 domain-containing protein [Pseudanabaena sp. 'Roaring Creek']|uniref:eCIS core domain-containing protein n=1 Tax=Pseudanabaena sp. 'Roaring Creek' TaxID=1681830 RepID=UPI0006D78C8C|nr:DUF4157 domain-containing protein [Pseudanabaena sp. 'Roaring Creek']